MTDIAHALPGITLIATEAQALTSGLAVIDWTSGAATRIFTIGADVSALARQHVANENIRATVFDFEPDIQTIKSGGALPFQIYLHGAPFTTAEASQAAITNYPAAIPIKCAMGGLYRGYSIGIASGTASAPVVDADTNVGIGDYLFAVQTSTGLGELRRVMAKPGGAVLTLDRPLSFTPDVGGADVFRAVLDFYWDAPALTHSDDAEHTLMAMLVVGEHANDACEARGMKLAMTINPINVGEPTRLTFASMVTSHDWITKPSPITSTIHGEAGTVPGTSNTYTALVSDAAGVMASMPFRGTVTPTMGIGFESVPGVGGTEGVLGYVATGFESCALEVEALFDEQWFIDHAAGTEKQVLIQVGNTASQLPWGMHWPQLEILNEPMRSAGSGLTGLKLSLRGRKNQASPGALTGVALRKWTSPFHLLVVA
jgi:hypothetical protein